MDTSGDVANVDSYSVNSNGNARTWLRRKPLLMLLGVIILMALVICAVAVSVLLLKSNYISSDSSAAVVKMQMDRMRLWMNSSADKCNDFYGYVCGNFASQYKLESLSNAYSVTDIVREWMHSLLINKLSTSDHKLQVVSYASSFYKECTQAKFNGNKVKGFISAMRVPFELETLLARSVIYMDSSIVKLTIKEDPFDESHSSYAVWMDAGDFILSPEHLTSESDDIVTSYRETLRLQSINCLTKEERSLIDQAVLLEIDLAKLTTSGLRDKNHLERVTLSSLDHFSTRINWTRVMLKVADIANHTQLSSDTMVILNDPSYIRSLDITLSRYSDQVINVYILLRFISTYGFALANHDYSDFDYMRRTSLSRSSYNRTDRCVDFILDTVPLIAGRLLLDEWTERPTQQSVDTVNDITERMRTVLLSKLKSNTWISDETRGKLIKKVEAIKVQISHPDWIFNDSVIEQMFPLEKSADSSGVNNNVIKLKEITLKNQLNKLSGMKDSNDGNGESSSDWPISPASVEVNYNLLSNSLTIPAASLHPLFFHPRQPDYINYAGIGISIASAFMEALSFTALQFDEKGTFLPTALPETFWSDLHSKTNCYINQYIEIHKLRAEHNAEGGGNVEEEKIALDAKRTLNQTIVDVQALQLTYDSLRDASAHLSSDPVHLSHENVTMSIDQLFTIFYQSNLCQSASHHWSQLEQSFASHLPARERTYLPFINCGLFNTSFNCTASEEGVERCKVW